MERFLKVESQFKLKRKRGGGGGGVYGFHLLWLLQTFKDCTHSSPQFVLAKIITNEKPSNSGVLIKFVLYRN